MKVAALLKPRLKFTNELPLMSGYFFVPPEKIEDEKAKAKYWSEQSPEHLNLVAGKLKEIPSEDFSIKNIENAFMQICQSHDIKLGQLAQATRLAISGIGAGPGLWEIIECLGKEECVCRIERAGSKW
jgi:glutamyl-tRNA synthetase